MMIAICLLAKEDFNPISLDKDNLIKIILCKKQLNYNSHYSTNK